MHKTKLQRRKKSWLNTLKKGIDFTHKLGRLVPGKDETRLQTTMKAIDFLSSFIPKEDEDKLLVDSGFSIRDDIQFVSMFKSLDLDKMFDSEIVEENSNSRMLEKVLYNKEVGTLLLRFGVESGIQSPLTKFFYSPDFDFEKLAEAAWKACESHILVFIEKENSPSRVEFKYQQFKPILGKQFGSSKQKMEDFIKRHISFKDKKISRSYLFLGEPGTGKSTMAQRFATDNHNKILRMEAKTLHNISMCSLMNLFEFLKPDCLIVDEIDKSGFYSNYQTGNDMLQLLEAIKESHPDVTMLFTANSIMSLPEPMIRPGRIDDIIEFDLPDEEDRKQILIGYLEGLEVDNKFLNEIVKECVGLSPAYIKEIAQLILSGNSNEALQMIHKQVKFIQRHRGNRHKYNSLADEYEELQAEDVNRFKKNRREKNKSKNAGDESKSSFANVVGDFVLMNKILDGNKKVSISEIKKAIKEAKRLTGVEVTLSDEDIERLSLISETKEMIKESEELNEDKEDKRPGNWN